MSADVRATSGAAMRQGPHQLAQKSTRTGTRDLAIISLNNSEFTSRGSAAGGRDDLQAPQRPVSARCSAGTRFFWPHCLQFLTTGMKTPTPRHRLDANGYRHVPASYIAHGWQSLISAGLRNLRLIGFPKHPLKNLVHVPQ